MFAVAIAILIEQFVIALFEDEKNYSKIEYNEF